MTYGPARIVPALRYRDPEGAIAWLCRAFGFREHLVARGKDNRVVHAQLALADGNGMIMLGPADRDSPFSRYMRQPDEIGGAETQCCYIIVADPDAHYAEAKRAGAEILLEIADKEHGGRDYCCRDPEGHIWCFGSYDPWSPPRE